LYDAFTRPVTDPKLFLIQLEIK
jgi:hypothetical protein